MEKGCLSVLMRASTPARHRSALRNQRSFWRWVRAFDRRPRPGKATLLTPDSSASRSFFAEK